jgi:hypothetical protein
MSEFFVTQDPDTGRFTFHFGELTLELPEGTQQADLDQARADWEATLGFSTHPVPQEVSMRQARLALLGAGLLSTVRQFLEALPGDEGEAARIEWEYAGSVTRSSALINSIGGQLGLTETQIDDLFRTAAAML